MRKKKGLGKAVSGEDTPLLGNSSINSDYTGTLVARQKNIDGKKFIRFYRNIVYFHLWVRYSLREDFLKRLLFLRRYPPIGLNSKDITTVQRIEHVMYGGKIVTEFLWPLFLSGFLINDMYQFASSPEARIDNSIFNSLFWVAENQSIITSQASRYWICPAVLLLGITVLGVSNMVLMGVNTHKDLLDIKASKGFTRPQSPGADFFALLLAVLLPEKLLWLELSKIKKEITSTTQRLILMRDEENQNVALIESDVKHSNTENSFLKKLINYSNKGGTFTQYMALRALAKIAYDLRYEQLLRMPPQDYDRRDVLQSRRDEAIGALQEIAKGKPSFKTVYANYLLWGIGISRLYRYDFIFILPSFALSLALLYADYRFWVSIIQLPMEMIVFFAKLWRCTQQYKTYVYMLESSSYECTVCGDWKEVYYRDVFNSQTCIDDLLRTQQTPQRIMAALHRILPLGISHIDLTQQDWPGWTETEMRSIFDLIQKSSGGVLDYFNLNCTIPMIQALSGNKTHILAETFKKLQVGAVSFVNVYLPINATAQIIGYFGNNTESIDLSHMNLGGADAVSLAKTLKSVVNLHQFFLDNNNFDNSAILLLSPSLQWLNLTVLSVAGNNFNEMGLYALSNPVFPTLKTLDLSNLAFENANLTVLKTFLENPTLETFIIRNSGINDQNLPTFISALKHSAVRYLDVSYNQLTPNSGLTLGTAVQNSSLEALILTQNPLSDQGIAYFSEFLPGCSLKQLGLSNIDLGDTGLKYLSQYLPQTQVNNIDFSSNQLTEVGMSYFATAIQQRNMTRVLFNGNAIGNAGLGALVSVITHSLRPTLRVLGLENTDISNIDDLFKALNGSILERLDIQDNIFGENDYIAAMYKLANTNLIWMNIRNTQATPKVAHAIATQLAFSKLEGLDMSDNVLGDTVVLKMTEQLITLKPNPYGLVAKVISPDEMRIVHAAKPNTALVRLSLDHTNITTKVARAICRVLPSTRISMQYLSMADNYINAAEVDLISCHTSGSSHLKLPTVFTFPLRVLSALLALPKQLTSALLANIPQRVPGTDFAAQENQSALATFHEIPLDAPNILMECTGQGEFLECRAVVKQSNGQTHFFHIIIDMAQGYAQQRFFSILLECLVAVALAFREEIAKRIQPYLPKFILALYDSYQKSPERLLINAVGEMALRAKHSSTATLLHDATYKVKHIVKESKKSSIGPKKNNNPEISSIYAEVAKMLLLLGGSYSAAYAIGWFTGNLLIGYAFMPLFSKSPRIYECVTKSYRKHGIFKALGTALDEICLSVPGGEYVRYSMTQ